MAAVNDCFTIGSTVLGTTCFNEEVEGEVLAFDHNTKMLILTNQFARLECRSKNSEALNDVHVLNLSLCSNVQVVKECNGNLVDDPQKLSLEQLKRRLRKTVAHRHTVLKSKNADVSPEGQEIYRLIAKQFKYTEVAWQGPNIQVFKEVTITPPYRAENVVSTSNNPSFCNYIKKMIEQFLTTRPAALDSSSTSTALAVVAVTAAAAPSTVPSMAAVAAAGNSTSQSASSSASSLSSSSTSNSVGQPTAAATVSSSNKMASGSPVVSAN